MHPAQCMLLVGGLALTPQLLINIAVHDSAGPGWCPMQKHRARSVLVSAHMVSVLLSTALGCAQATVAEWNAYREEGVIAHVCPSVLTIADGRLVPPYQLMPADCCGNPAIFGSYANHHLIQARNQQIRSTSMAAPPRSRWPCACSSSLVVQEKEHSYDIPRAFSPSQPLTW